MSSEPDSGRSQASLRDIQAAFAPPTKEGVRVAHAVPKSMAGYGRHGVARCGFPLDELTFAPDLDWTTLDPAQQCEFCRAELDPLNG